MEKGNNNVCILNIKLKKSIKFYALYHYANIVSILYVKRKTTNNSIHNNHLSMLHVDSNAIYSIIFFDRFFFNTHRLLMHCIKWVINCLNYVLKVC